MQQNSPSYICKQTGWGVSGIRDGKEKRNCKGPEYFGNNTMKKSPDFFQPSLQANFLGCPAHEEGLGHCRGLWGLVLISGHSWCPSHLTLMQDLLTLKMEVSLQKILSATAFFFFFNSAIPTPMFPRPKSSLVWQTYVKYFWSLTTSRDGEEGKEKGRARAMPRGRKNCASEISEMQRFRGRKQRGGMKRSHVQQCGHECTSGVQPLDT